MEGEPLDVGRMLCTPEGKPRIAIFSIAHLGDAERMFFVSLLLNQTLGWMRTQSGTTSLRAILYMDEIFGYFPPVANPPSKLPLLTLLKQARAFGVGVVLATQNPVDLDYKGLSNTGTWFIGRLQTERDKARVLDGLEGAAAGAGSRFDRGRMEEILAGLGNRIFLMNNVHDDGPEVFESRWAMSYLRGPLTRSQIKTLMAGRTATAPAGAPRAASAPAATAARRPHLASAASPPHRRPSPPGDPCCRRTSRSTSSPSALPTPAGAALVYQPMLFGAAEVRFADAKKGLDTSEPVAIMTPLTAEAVAADWDRAVEAPLTAGDLEASPEAGRHLRRAARRRGQAEELRRLAKGLRRLALPHAEARPPDAARASRPSRGPARPRGTSARACSTPAASSATTRSSSSARSTRRRRPRSRRRSAAPSQAVERESEQVTQQGLQAAISIGTTLIGAFLGRKAVTASTLGRATTAARGAGRVLKERQDVGRAQETVEALQQQLADLDEAFKADAEKLGASGDALTEPIETLSVRPSKQNITVKLVALAWVPRWQDGAGQSTPAWQ